MSKKNEAAPARARTDTRPLQPQGQAPQPPAGQQQQQASSWDITVPGAGTWRVPGGTEQEARQAVAELVNQQRPGMSADPSRFTVVPSPQNEMTSGGGVGGYQAPLSGNPNEQRLRNAIREMVKEVVRKKAGGGGYQLYSPNKGKKKSPKPVGEFPTRIAAKKAELARFPPKDPEQLKKARKRMDKVMKDPKKRAAAERQDISGHKPPPKKKSAKKEAFTRLLAAALRERLFRDDEVPGSAWDEKISSLHPDAIASDKKLAGHHKNIERASMGALGDAHKALAKALRGTAKVNPGDIAHDPDRRKTFIPVMLDCDGTEIGPVHLYVDGGHVKIEVSRDAREQIAGMEPPQARDIRGGLMSFEEDHLPKIDQAKKAWDERDAYLDKLHGKLEKHVNGMSGVEAHLAKQLLNKNGRRR